MTHSEPIRRGFVDVAHGQMHYRTSGEGRPLLFLHASPGSSRQLVPMIDSFAGEGRIIAPDTPGNGDSDALPLEAPEITDLAAAMLGFLDAMELESVDVYGSHTGGTVAAELAILAPDRVRSVILDGVMVLTPEELEDLLEHYAHPFPADREGAYLAKIFQFCRDQYLFFPWFKRTRANRRDNGLGSAEDIRAWVLEVLKANETYYKNYRAAFRWNAAERLPLVEVPGLIIAGENDPLFDTSRDIAEKLKGGRFTALPRFDDEDFAATRRSAMTDFIASAEGAGA
ncbi:alpha/beta hydrolase [Henriciella sp. AS95]|uniref:alpha/beta fold hydrolase n=1 Tax=Henriciella sp. AS95 TaxID=3135782 RepID=UPI00316BF31D